MPSLLACERLRIQIVTLYAG